MFGGGSEDRMSAMVLAEANRLIEVREGKTVSKIPAIQAVLRKLVIAAAEGDLKAAGKVLDVVMRTESGRATAAQEFLAEAGRYKEKHRPAIEQAEREGSDPPDIYPHPDDVLINKHTGEVTVDGPETKDQAAAHVAFWKTALQATSRYLTVKDALVKDPKNRELRKELNELQPYFDFVEMESRRGFRHQAAKIARAAVAPAEQEDEEPDGRG